MAESRRAPSPRFSPWDLPDLQNLFYEVSRNGEYKMNLILLSIWIAFLNLSQPTVQAAPKTQLLTSVATEGVCYDGRFCHGDVIPGMRDQWMCFDQGGLSWWHTRALIAQHAAVESARRLSSTRCVSTRRVEESRRARLSHFRSGYLNQYAHGVSSSVRDTSHCTYRCFFGGRPFAGDWLRTTAAPSQASPRPDRQQRH